MKDTTVYVIETKKDIWWSRSKMDATYKHIEFFWRDKARYKEMTMKRFNQLRQTTDKKVWEIEP